MTGREHSDSDRCRQLRHELINTIFVIKLELRVAKNKSVGEAEAAISSVEAKVRTLHEQLTELYTYMEGENSGSQEGDSPRGT